MSEDIKMQRGPKGEVPILAKGTELTDEQLEQVSAGGLLGDQSYKTGDTTMFPCSLDGTSMVPWTCIEGSKVLSSKAVRVGKYRWTTINEVESVWECSRCGEHWRFNDLTGWARA